MTGIASCGFLVASVLSSLFELLPQLIRKKESKMQKLERRFIRIVFKVIFFRLIYLFYSDLNRAIGAIRALCNDNVVSETA
jgi:hypothetical protein